MHDITFSTRGQEWLMIVPVQFCSVIQSCSTLGDPMNYSKAGFPVHHQLPELTQTHVHRVGDAIQPSHALSSFFPPAFNLSQHQGLFQWVSSWHQVAEVLEFQLQLKMIALGNSKMLWDYSWKTVSNAKLDKMHLQLI